MTSGEAEEHAAAGVRTVGKNAISLFGAYVLPRVFTVGSVVVAARVLGTERFGVYGAAAAFAVILSILATLGMHPLLVRDLARDPSGAPRVLRAAHVVKTGSNLLMLGLVYALARWGLELDSETLAAALLLAGGYAIAAYAENLSAYFQAVERMHVWTEASAIFGLVTGLLGSLMVWTTASVAWFCAAPLAGQVASLCWLVLRAPRSVRRGAPVGWEDVADLARSLAPFAVAFVVLTMYYKLDVLLLERWRDVVDVGLYTAAYKFVDVFHALVIVGVGALYPWLARSAPAVAAARAAGEPIGRWAGTRALEVAVLVALPVGGVLFVAAPAAVRLVFGPEYADAAPVALWLACAFPALALNLLGAYLLGAAHRMGPVAALYAGTLVVKTALDALLIPRYGPVGAAAAMVAETRWPGGSCWSCAAKPA